jgi:NADPH:quinone reductase-like Zn-dependent oxidoreductase
MTATGGPEVLQVAELPGLRAAPGTYAEFKIADERYLARKPETLSFAEAAAAPLVTITAWESLRERARVQPGQSVLVQGGAGGVGHMSVQIARVAGARGGRHRLPRPEGGAGRVSRRRAAH